MAINRTELVSAIADRSGLTKAQADEALSAFQATIIDALSDGESVRLTGLMTIERVERAARTGRNPRTGEEIQIPGRYGVKLTPGLTLKNAVAK